MRRATIALAVAAAVILTGLFQRPPAAALGMTQVTLNCTDGTSFTIVVDADTLTGLVASVQGMVDYPAGLNCTLIQVPLLKIGRASCRDRAQPSAGCEPSVHSH